MIEYTDNDGKPLSDMELTRQLKAEKRAHRLFVVRNTLNIIFIILSLAAIVGVLYFEKTDPRIAIAYGTAGVAVVVKMCEALFRMPGFRRKD